MNEIKRLVHDKHGCSFEEIFIIIITLSWRLIGRFVSGWTATKTIYSTFVKDTRAQRSSPSVITCLDIGSQIPVS